MTQEDGILIWLGASLARLVGKPELASLVTAVVVIVMMALAAVASLMLLGVVRKRITAGSLLAEFLASLRFPIALLAAFSVLLLDAEGLISAELSGRLRLDIAFSVLLHGVLFWISLHFLGMLERRYVEKAKAAGSLRLRLFQENVSVGVVSKFFMIIRLVVLAILGLVVLNALGVKVSSILAFGGISGLLVGIAARDFLTNIFSGLHIFMVRPFEVGDWIVCRERNIEGVVQEIGWQHMRIHTFDQRPVYIPNSVIATSVVENAQRMTGRRIYEYFGLRYEDMDRVDGILKKLREYLEKHPHVNQNNAKLVAFDRYGESTLDCFIYCVTTVTQWEEFHKVKSGILLDLAATVEETGAEFAFPTRVVHNGDEKPALGLASD